LLYKLNNPLLQYCFDEEYWQLCFHNVRDELKAITIFSIYFLIIQIYDINYYIDLLNYKIEYKNNNLFI